MPSAGTSRPGATSRFAVGNPRPAPRCEPCTTVPPPREAGTEQLGCMPHNPRPSAAGGCDFDDTLSTIGHAADVESHPLQGARGRPSGHSSKRKPSPAATTSAPAARRIDSANSSAGSFGEPRVGNRQTRTSSMPNPANSSIRRRQELDRARRRACADADRKSPTRRARRRSTAARRRVGPSSRGGSRIGDRRSSSSTARR